MTIRLQPHLHAEAAGRAKARRWSMSQYVEWCVEEAMRADSVAPPRKIATSMPRPQESNA